ncbi:MAG: hypothetical protein FD130_101 [Halothiobacillaceae bacterium]|nr:MAG: hypothetical protein FD130_101 [Halothiobacillaceae bacterium]
MASNVVIDMRNGTRLGNATPGVMINTLPGENRLFMPQNFDTSMAALISILTGLSSRIRRRIHEQCLQYYV